MTSMNMASAEAEYKNNKDLRKSDVEALKEWLQKQPHLPKISEFELILFLHSNYYRVEPTKTTIDAFYTMKTHLPEFFSNRDPIGCENLCIQMRTLTNIILPGTTKEGYKVLYTKFIDPDPSRYIFVESIKLFSMIIELSLLTESTCPGHIILYDMQGASFGHTLKLSPWAMKHTSHYQQEALPIRLKAMHIINTLPFLNTILNMLKPLMKEELLDKVIIHSDLESLAQYVPIDILPNEQGGKAGSIKDLHDAQIKKLIEHRAWFMEDELRSKVDESVRPGKAKNATDLFGFDGSFKKLDID